MKTQTFDVAVQGILTNNNANDERHYYVIINRNGGCPVARWLPVTTKDEPDSL